MSDFITGREIIVGVKHASTWRTAVECGADDGVLITSEGIGPKAPNFVDDDSLGKTDIRCVMRTNENAAGNIEGYLRYEGWDVLLAHALGTAGTPSLVSGGSVSYENTLSPADSISGIFTTLAIKKSATSHPIWEVPSAKWGGFTISGAIGELVKVTFNMMGNKIENQSSVNTSATMANVTYPEGCEVLKMDSNFKIRMNTQSGAALADSDKIYPMSFELTYNRPLRENWEASYDDMSEPVQDGFAEATLKLTFDKYNLDDFMDAIAADTEYKMDITFEGNTIEGSIKYTFRVDIPKLMVVSAESPVSGPGVIPHNVELRLLGVDSAPTGMTGVTDPISIYTINKRSTSPLS